MLLSTIKKRIKHVGLNGLKWVGMELLTREQTRQRLQPFKVESIPAFQIVLPTIKDASDQTKTLFKGSIVHVNPCYVWRIDKGREQMSLMRCGSLRLGGKLLLTDFTVDLFKDPFIRPRRLPLRVETLVAPWSQYFETDSKKIRYRRYITFQGYYDFMIMLAAKLCRIRERLPESVLAQCCVAYPLLNQSYERDLHRLIGFRPDQILDSRHFNISFDSCFVGDSEPESWRYPSPGDVISLKRQVEANVSFERTSLQRIYIQRRGRRRVLNEQALIQMLVAYGFVVIEDVPRSIDEQVLIYKNASFILGPHGASFTNIIWCEPGTYLLELFNAQFVPDYYHYLSQVMDMEYAACCFGMGVRNELTAKSADILVDISAVEDCIQQLLSMK